LGVTFLRKLIWIGVMMLPVFAVRGEDPGLTLYRDVTLANHDINDGDSFFVQVGDRVLHLRLYFVDCPETSVNNDHDARRVQEQARYFGIDDAERVPWLGEQAGDFVRQVLSAPFTVYTSHAKALGGRGSERIYAFVVTSTGRDLGELLIENGFARNFGVKRSGPDGTRHDELELRLRDMESAAMLARRGIWQESNANRLVEYRAQQRADRDIMQGIMTSTVRLVERPLDLNTATRKELQRVPGIGPATADRIIQARPFTAIDDLQRVPGIGEKTLDNIRP